MLIDQLRAWVDNPTAPQHLELPDVEAPSLTDLSTTVKALPIERELTEEMLLDIYERRINLLTPRTHRELGDFAAHGDEVQVDMVFYHKGHVVPRTAAGRYWLVAGEPWELPGVSEALIGATIGEMVKVPIEFPTDWPATALRGMAGEYHMKVLAIDTLQPLDPSRPDFLRALGIDADIPAFMVQLREDYVDSLTAELINQGQHQIFALLRARSPVAIPAELIEREIFEIWAEHEGCILLRLGANESDLNTSFAAWLRDPSLWEQTKDRLHISMLLGAIAKEEKLTLTEDGLEERLDEVVASMGINTEQARQMMQDDPSSVERFMQVAFHLMCVDYVMEHADITYEEA